MCLAHCNCFKNVYYYGLYEHAEIKIHSKEKCSFFSKWKSVTVVLCVWQRPFPQLHWAVAAEDHAGSYHCPSQTLVVTFLLSLFLFGKIHCGCLFIATVSLSTAGLKILQSLQLQDGITQNEPSSLSASWTNKAKLEHNMTVRRKESHLAKNHLITCDIGPAEWLVG